MKHVQDKTYEDPALHGESIQPDWSMVSDWTRDQAFKWTAWVKVGLDQYNVKSVRRMIVCLFLVVLYLLDLALILLLMLLLLWSLK